MPTEFDGEIYYTATEAAKYLKVSRETFYAKREQFKDLLKEYEIGMLSRVYYRKSELDQLKGPRLKSPTDD